MPPVLSRKCLPPPPRAYRKTEKHLPHVCWTKSKHLLSTKQIQCLCFGHRDAQCIYLGPRHQHPQWGRGPGQGLSPIERGTHSIDVIHVIDTYIHTNTYQYIPIHTNTYQYIPIHTNTYQYIPIHTNTYQYIPIHTNTYQYIHTNT